eukprot:2615604-Pyramimonas_sp.AAC.1
MSSEWIEIASSPSDPSALFLSGRCMGSVVGVSGTRKPRQARFEQSRQGIRSPLRGAGRGAARAGC